ncbi:hypothetical protein F5887DRAFT_1069669 [Amanita rubescens]|nr:hypothetical protein F5887DRAFT_1069669 [Amanita rubescens]
MDLQSATTIPTTLRLNCLIEDEDKVFPVTVGNVEVADLKNEIKKQCAVSFEGVDPHDLELWKPKELNLIAARPSNILVDCIKHLDFSKFTDKLEAVDNVFDIFPPEPLKGYIHIIVKVPHTGEPLMLVNAARLTAFPPPIHPSPPLLHAFLPSVYLLPDPP